MFSSNEMSSLLVKNIWSWTVIKSKPGVGEPPGSPDGMQPKPQGFISHLHLERELRKKPNSKGDWMKRFIQTNFSDIWPRVWAGCKRSRPPTGGVWPSETVAENQKWNHVVYREKSTGTFFVLSKLLLQYPCSSLAMVLEVIATVAFPFFPQVAGLSPLIWKMWTDWLHFH